MVELINRTGLDKLPDEYFDGEYSSLTDVFCLSELFNRLLIKTENTMIFSCHKILQKIMESNKKDRFTSFSAIKDIISKNCF